MPSNSPLGAEYTVSGGFLAGRAKGLAIGSAVFALALLIFGYSAFLDPDPHHDGVQIAPAIAVAEGLRIHSDVYDHYGPVTAWIHGASVAVFGTQLLTIRIVTALLLAISATLIVFLARRVLPYPRQAWLLAAVWIATWPGRSVDSTTYLFLPWPSITLLVLQLAIAIVLLRILTKPDSSPLVYLGLGVLIGVAAITRLNTGLPMAAVVTLTLILLVPWKRDQSLKQLTAYGIGALASVGAIFLTLAWQGSITAYLQDAILGPLSGEATDGVTSWFFYRNTVLLGSVPLLLGLLVIYFVGRKYPTNIVLPWVLGGFGVLTLTVWTTTSLVGSPLRDLILSRLTWAPALDHQAFQIMFVVILLMPFAIVLIVWRIVRQLGSLEHASIARRVQQLRDLPPSARMMTALAALSLVSLIQLFPFIDPNHVWWAVPLPLVFITWVFTAPLTRRWAWSVVVVASFPAILIAIPRAIDYVQIPRTQIDTGVLNGMWVPDERVDDVEKVDLLLGQLSPGINRFDCWNGLFAVWTGEYVADDAAFVNWAPSFDSKREMQPGGMFVQCVDVGGGITPSEVPSDFELGANSNNISISYYNWMDLRIYHSR